MRPALQHGMCCSMATALWRSGGKCYMHARLAVMQRNLSPGYNAISCIAECLMTAVHAGLHAFRPL